MRLMQNPCVKTCVHIYFGDGKGKTTAAMGLALRALGAGLRPVIVQFLKTEQTSERRVLEALPKIDLLPLPAAMKFVFQMNEAEKKEAAGFCLQLLQKGIDRFQQQKEGLLLLDEVLDAVETGLLPQGELENALIKLSPRQLGQDGEAGSTAAFKDVVLTGRRPSPKILELADYCTEMRAVRHPYGSGLPARRGIEY